MDVAATTLVELEPLMVRTRGRREVMIGLVDGPIDHSHPALKRARIKALPGGAFGRDRPSRDIATRHATFIAGLFAAERGSESEGGLCPECPLLCASVVRERNEMPTASDLAEAIERCANQGVRVINLSLTVGALSAAATRSINAALDHAARNGVVVIAAAGNDAGLTASAINAHPWVVPVVGYQLSATPMLSASLSLSIGRRGLGAPGSGVAGIDIDPGAPPLTGSSIATAFVTAAVALIMALLPAVAGHEVRQALLESAGPTRRSIVPPLMRAGPALRRLQDAMPSRRFA